MVQAVFGYFDSLFPEGRLIPHQGLCGTITADAAVVDRRVSESV